MNTFIRHFFTVVLIFTHFACKKTTEPNLLVLDYDRLSDNIVVAEEDVGLGGVNISIFSGTDGTILIDSGYYAKLSRLKDTVEHLNIDEVTLVVNTHSHDDHIEGNLILGDSGTIIGHENNDTHVNSSQDNNIQFIGIADEYSFHFNGETIYCIPMTSIGHSDSDIIIYLENSKILFLGDLYLSESFPSVFVPYGASVQVAVSALENILNNYPTDVILIPGHGKATTMEELQSYVNMLKETITIVRNHIIAGDNLSTIISKNVLSEYDEWGNNLVGLDTEFWIKAIYYSYPN